MGLEKKFGLKIMEVPLYIASTWRRIVAYFVDQVVAMIMFIPIWIEVAASFFQSGNIVISWRWLIACWLLQFCYRWLFLYFLGATLGMLMVGIRVVEYPNEKPLTLSQSLIRVLTDSLSLFFSQGLRALALMRFDRRHVADLVAETWVRQRHPLEFPPRPRWILAMIFCLYFSVTGFLSIYHLTQKSDWNLHELTIHLGQNRQP